MRNHTVTRSARAISARAAGTVAPRMMSLGDQVYERLLDAILSGALAAGSRIKEMELAAEMGTSQGPVREALQRLEREGLLSRQARVATFVAEVSIPEMRELFVARSVIESFAIQALISRITDEQIHLLEAIVAGMHRAAQQDDMVAFVKWDREFHNRICEWSGRTTLYRAWVPLYSQIQRFVAQNHPKYFETIEEIAQQHEPVLEAIRQRDADRAAEEIRRHVMLIWSRIDGPAV